MKRTVKLSLAGVLVVLPAAAAATDMIPAHFIPESECLELTKPCECADVPDMERFLSNQEAAKQTWISLRTQTQTTGVPAGPDDVAEAFAMNFASDPAIRTQFETCPDFDASVNSAGRIAGGSLTGGAMLDPCYCKTFCREIVESTIVHEDAHRVFNLGVISIYASIGVACKAGVLDGPMCDGMDALAREGSEIYAYGKGNSALRQAIDEIVMQSPTMDCTTETPVDSVSPQPTEQLPAGFFDRVKMLGRKFVQGQ